MTTQTNITADILQTAINDAREWLATDEGDNEAMTADLDAALNAFVQAIDGDDIVGAVDACEDISSDWASGDRSRYKALFDLANLIGQTVETGDDSGDVLDFDRDEAGNWLVKVGWESGITTSQPVARLADWGVI
jgi:hypothetical protein